MFRSICIIGSLIALLTFAPFCNGQTTVWLSDNESFADLDITTAAPPGTTGSFDIWIKTEHFNRYNGIDLNLMTVGNAIEFTGADMVISENRFRLQREPMVIQDGTAITDMWAYAGIGGLDLGTGIGPGVPVDDEVLDAYRFATVRYRIIGIGISELRLKVGEDGFGNVAPNLVRLGIDDPISQNIPGATDAIIDGRIQLVPEPASLFLMAVGGLFLRR